MQSSKIRFLVPLDFSEQSLIAVEQAINLASVYRAEITLLSVIQEQIGLFAKKRNVKSQKTELLKQLKELVSSFDVQANVMVIEGRVYETILEQSEALNVDFIIMGTSRAKGLKRKFIGSNTLRVVKMAKCAVITIKGARHRKGCKTVLLPIDLSKETTQKVKTAIEFARKFDDCKVSLVSMIDSTDSRVRIKLTNQIEKLKIHVENNGVRCVAAIVKIVKGEDTFPNAIIAYANKAKADAIMIMTQQELNPTEFFIGSKAQTIINGSHVPVISVVPTMKGVTGIL